MPTTLDVREVGATGDGSTLDTEAIQDAIDRCAEVGGGAVSFPAGRYLIGSLFIRDNVTLNLSEDALLLGSPHIKHYSNPDAYIDGADCRRGWALIIAADTHDVGITGGGTIDGCGAVFAEAPERPMLLRFIRSQRVRVESVSLRNAGAWASHFFQCRDVSISDLTIKSRCAQNNDGIDIDSTADVTITGCDIDTGDDAICFKTTSALPCRDVVVSDCDLSSDWGAIKFGTESMGDFERFRILGCRIRDTKGGGIKILGVDGAHIRDIVLQDITMDQVDMPLFIRLGRRLRTYRPGDTQHRPGSIRDVTVRNVEAVAADAGHVIPATGAFITGSPGLPVEDVTLANVRISLAGGGAPEHAGIEPPGLETDYPEYRSFGVLPAYGVYCRHARGITVHDLRLQTRQPDARPPILLQDVSSSTFGNVTRPAGATSGQPVVLRDCNDIMLDRG
jgi:hypothetical protein